MTCCKFKNIISYYVVYNKRKKIKKQYNSKCFLLNLIFIEFLTDAQDKVDISINQI